MAFLLVQAKPASMGWVQVQPASLGSSLTAAWRWGPEQQALHNRLRPLPQTPVIPRLDPKNEGAFASVKYLGM